MKKKYNFRYIVLAIVFSFIFLNSSISVSAASSVTFNVGRWIDYRWYGLNSGTYTVPSYSDTLDFSFTTSGDLESEVTLDMPEGNFSSSGGYTITGSSGTVSYPDYKPSTEDFYCLSYNYREQMTASGATFTGNYVTLVDSNSGTSAPVSTQRLALYSYFSLIDNEIRLGVNPIGSYIERVSTPTMYSTTLHSGLVSVGLSANLKANSVYNHHYAYTVTGKSVLDSLSLSSNGFFNNPTPRSFSGFLNFSMTSTSSLPSNYYDFSFDLPYGDGTDFVRYSGKIISLSGTVYLFTSSGGLICSAPADYSIVSSWRSAYLIGSLSLPVSIPANTTVSVLYTIDSFVPSSGFVFHSLSTSSLVGGPNNMGRCVFTPSLDSVVNNSLTSADGANSDLDSSTGSLGTKIDEYDKVTDTSVQYDVINTADIWNLDLSIFSQLASTATLFSSCITNIWFKLGNFSIPLLLMLVFTVYRAIIGLANFTTFKSPPPETSQSPLSDTTISNNDRPSRYRPDRWSGKYTYDNIDNNDRPGGGYRPD